MQYLDFTDFDNNFMDYHGCDSKHSSYSGCGCDHVNFFAPVDETTYLPEDPCKSSQYCNKRTETKTEIVKDNKLNISVGKKTIAVVGIAVLIIGFKILKSKK